MGLLENSFVFQSFGMSKQYFQSFCTKNDRGSTVVKVLFYKSEGRWFDPSWCEWIFR